MLFAKVVCKRICPLSYHFLVSYLLSLLLAYLQLVDNIAVFKAAAGARPLMLLPGKPPLALPLEHPLLSTGAVKGGQKQVSRKHYVSQ